MSCRLCERVRQPVGIPSDWRTNYDATKSDVWAIAAAGPAVLKDVGTVCGPHFRATLLFLQLLHDYAVEHPEEVPVADDNKFTPNYAREVVPS